MIELVEFIAKSLVDKPEDVVVTETEEDGTVVLNLEVADEDKGRVIGKGGKIANSIRNILRSTATKSEKKVRLNIVD